MTAPDPLTAELIAIRERSKCSLPDYLPISGDTVQRLFVSAEDVPRLLAAVQAALKVAAQLEPQPGAPFSALEEDRMWVRQQCADMIREAITTKLLGEEGSDGHD